MTHDPASCRSCAYERPPKDDIPWPDMATCPHDETWFSRTICAEPCGMMHDVCQRCGIPLGCYFYSDEYADHLAASA